MNKKAAQEATVYFPFSVLFWRAAPRGLNERHTLPGGFGRIISGSRTIVSSSPSCSFPLGTSSMAALTAAVMGTVGEVQIIFPFPRTRWLCSQRTQGETLGHSPPGATRPILRAILPVRTRARFLRFVFFPTSKFLLHVIPRKTSHISLFS